MKNECLIPSYTIHDIGDIETLSEIYPASITELNVPKIWNRTKGKDVVVAVLDSGTANRHPDLMGNIDIDKCRSFIPDENLYDLHIGHGTHVAGTIGAINNQIGIVGVAPEVTLVGVKVLNKNGRSEGDSIYKGLRYCLDDLNPDVINMSLGGTNPMPNEYEIIKKLVNEKNIPVVCSAGNNGENKILYPANYDECIAVGSYSASLLKDRSIFSSWGDSLDIMAPGEKILSCYLNGQYSVMSGTSMATPAITGVIALIIAYHKSLKIPLTVDNIKDLLYANCVDIGTKGKDDKSGWGIVNPEHIFAYMETGRTTNTQLPPAKLSFWQKIVNLFSRK